MRLHEVVLRYPLTRLTRGSLKTALLHAVRRKNGAAQAEYIEALRGLSLTIQHGDRLGVIGRNGSGKSTLLRTVAGIYPIHSGSIEVRGRLRSLFDVSLGFEIEDTGRENIYYRGYLLGFRKEQIEAIEQQVIEFAGLGPFIDLPLRTYSSGMLVRLGFSISTALEGDILLLDEVLAAGDAEFLERAQNRIREIVASTACMILVSHDMAAVKEFCNRAVWMDGGLIRAEGDPETITREYLASTHHA